MNEILWLRCCESRILVPVPIYHVQVRPPDEVNVIDKHTTSARFSPTLTFDIMNRFFTFIDFVLMRFSNPQGWKIRG